MALGREAAVAATTRIVTPMPQVGLLLSVCCFRPGIIETYEHSMLTSVSLFFCAVFSLIYEVMPHAFILEGFNP